MIQYDFDCETCGRNETMWRYPTSRDRPVACPSCGGAMRRTVGFGGLAGRAQQRPDNDPQAAEFPAQNWRQPAGVRMPPNATGLTIIGSRMDTPIVMGSGSQMTGRNNYFDGPVAYVLDPGVELDIEGDTHHPPTHDDQAPARPPKRQRRSKRGRR